MPCERSRTHRNAAPGQPGAARYTPIPLAQEPLSVLRAGQDLKPLKTLVEVPAGGEPTPFVEKMKRAEELLKAGSYLDAVDAYQQAMATEPENALAVIGRAQAELAAGMYSSAAYDLKFIFARKPQLMSVHYALSSFMPAKRLDTVSSDLLSLTTQERSDTASFLYCFVSYNTDHEQDLKKELDRWAIRAPHDQWQVIAAKAWGK